MTRLEWQQFAERWLIDAKRLLDEKRWSAAYYVAGYAVESALKACVLAHVAVRPEVIFDDRKFSERCWTHSPEELLKISGLAPTLVADMGANPALAAYWSTVKDWNEKSRYETTPHYMAKRLYRAISDRKNGVMSWIKAHW
jgi:HEPN domain-containing protein